MKIEVRSDSRPICFCKQKQGVISLAALVSAESEDNSELLKKSVTVAVSSWIIGRLKELVQGRVKQD